jgi:HEAT repeat protein
MSLQQKLQAAAATGLAAGLFGLVLADGANAAGKKEEAKKYHEQLKTATDARKKITALEELGKLGQIMKVLAEPAVPDIFLALEDKDPAVRRAAAEALGKCDPDPKQAVPALLKLLKEDSDERVKISAVRGLGYMGDTARSATRDLRAIVLANRKDNQLSPLGRAAAEALRSINAKR